MKKALALIAFILSVQISLHAQQGSVLFYGNINLQKYTGAAEVHDFSLTQGIGYQFSQKMTTGAEITFASSKIGNQTSRLFRVGPFFRYTLPLNDLFSVYAQAGGGYIQRIAGIKETGFYFNLFPALYLKVYKGFGLNFSTGELNFSKLGELKEFRLNYGIIPTVGVSLNVGGNKAE